MTDEADEDREDRDGRRARRGVRWWLVVPSVALVLAPLWVLLTAAGAVLAAHPAYPVALGALLVVGLVGVVLALRGPRR